MLPISPFPWKKSLNDALEEKEENAEGEYHSLALPDR